MGTNDGGLPPAGAGLRAGAAGRSTNAEPAGTNDIFNRCSGKSPAVRVGGLVTGRAQFIAQHLIQATGVSCNTIAKRVKEALQLPPSLPRLRPKRAQKERWEALGLDEIWTLVGRKRRMVWLAVGRASRRIVA